MSAQGSPPRHLRLLATPEPGPKREAELPGLVRIKDPVLRAAVMRAYRAWAWTQT